MRKQDPFYDTYCLQPGCIAKKDAFFLFHPENPHIAANHEIKSIHHLTFFGLFQPKPSKASQKTAASSLKQDYRETLCLLETVVDSVLQEISQIVRERLFECSFREAQSRIEQISRVDLEYTMRKMSEGSYDFLSILLEFQQNQALSFKDFQECKINGILQKLSFSIERKKQQVLNLFQTYFLMKKEKRQIGEIEQDTNIVLNMNLSMKNHLQPTNQVAFNAKPQQLQPLNKAASQSKPQRTANHQPENDGRSEESEEIDEAPKEVRVKLQDNTPRFVDRNRQIQAISSDLEDSQQQNQKSSKSKQIQKQKRAAKKRSRRADCSQICKLQENEVAVRRIYTPKKAFQKISSLAPHCRALHIFDHKFATRTTLNQIFSSYPLLRVLTINCWVQKKAVEMLPLEKLQQLELFCPRWDLGRFHQEYTFQVYFPTRPRFHLKQRTPGNLSYFLECTSKNKFLWVQNGANVDTQRAKKATDLQISKASLKKFRSELACNLKTLKVSPSSCAQEFNALVDERQWFYQKLANLITNNQKLSQINLDNVLILNQWKENGCLPELNMLFQQISFLPQLRVFTLVKDPAYQIYYQIDQEHVSRLSKLQYLTLEKICINPAPADKKFGPFSMLRNFRRLKHLTLYDCQMVASEHLVNLHPDSFKTLQLLNLGKTSINNKCIGTMAKMTNLTALNLQKTIISADDILNMLTKYEEIHKKSHPLKKLNVKNKIHDLTRHCLKMLSSQAKLEHSKQQFIKSANWTSKLQNMTELQFVHNHIFNQEAELQPQEEKLELLKISSLFPEYRSKVFQVLLSEHDQKFDGWFANLSDDQARKIASHANLMGVAEMTQIVKHVPHLEYLNISYNFNLVSLDLSSLKKLKHLVKDSYFQFQGAVCRETTLFYCELKQ